MQPPRNPARLAMQLAVALVVSAAALYWAFRDADLEAVGAGLRATPIATVFAYALTQAVILVLRGIRWGVLVRPLGASVGAIASSSLVGIPATFFVPFRLGEFVRPVMLSRRGVALGHAMSAVVVERVADGLLNVGLFFALLAFLPASIAIADEIRTLALVALAGFGGALTVLVACAIARGTVLALLGRVLGILSPRLAATVVRAIATFLDGIALLGDARRIAAFFVLTIAYWALNGAATHALASSHAAGLPLLAGPFVISVVVFAIMAPAAPGFLGTFELGFRLGLAPFAVTASTAVVIALISHTVTLVLFAASLLAGFTVGSRSTARP